MSLFIKGMELPKSGEKIIILTSSGYIEDVSGQVIEGAEAVSIPTPHGRLGDLDALMELYEPAPEDVNEWEHYTTTISAIRQNIKDAPTIIEAEE